ncbi:holo-ACP synthase, partial [Clostridioides difficile]|nr:holo-ACP synthase [Clostridioides difficile]
MNIFDIGVDIIEIDRIIKAVDKSNSILEKILTDRE